jgi:hypothetical protein
MVGTVGPREDAAASFAVKYHTVLEHEYRIRMLYPSTAPLKPILYAYNNGRRSPAGFDVRPERQM